MGFKNTSELTKNLSLSIVVLFISMFVMGSYFFSFEKGEINSNLFTISQSLAFGNDIVMTILLTIIFGLLIYMIYLKGPNNGLYFRIFLLIIMYAFINTIFYVTTYYNKTDHYILAGFIFTAALIYIFYSSYLMFKNFKNFSRLNSFLSISNILVPAFSLVVFTALIISNILNVPYMFPIMENTMLTCMGFSILINGYG